MTPLSPTALEEAARDLCKSMHGNCDNAGYISDYYTQHATAAITAYLAQREKEGFVEVPKEASEEVVNAALDKHAEITPCESPFGPDGYFALLYRAMVAAAQNEGE